MFNPSSDVMLYLFKIIISSFIVVFILKCHSKSTRSHTVSLELHVYLAKRFHRRRFLEISQSETRMACGGHAC